MTDRTVEIKNLPPTLRRRFVRALELLGAGSQAQWLYIQIRRAIREAEVRFGQDFNVLTDEERWIAEVIADGAAEIQQIAEETHCSISRARTVVGRLIQFGYVEERRRGGKTESARGAATKLYFLARPIPSRPGLDDEI